MDEVIKEMVDRYWAATVCPLSPHIHRNRDPKAILEVVRTKMSGLAEELEGHMYERLRNEGWREPA